ncbi:MAG: hypothetical protein WCK58_05145, partial [Chloroflexota bacterium]
RQRGQGATTQIVGGILVVLGIIVAVLLGIFAQKLASSLPVNGDGTFKACSFISNTQVESVIGSGAVAFPLDGFLGDIIKAPVDERLLKNADDCWILSDPNTTDTGTFGRIARQDDGNAASTFASAKSAGKGTYYGSDQPGLGDEAFCTGGGEGLGYGVFARKGNTLVFVSLFDATALAQDSGTTGDGVQYSQAICDLSSQLAAQILH